MMSYLYAAMFGLIGLLLIFRLGKENKLFYLAGSAFIFMGGWWFIKEYFKLDLFHGAWGWIFRGMMAVLLVIFLVAYFRERKKDAESDNSGEKR